MASPLSPRATSGTPSSSTLCLLRPCVIFPLVREGLNRHTEEDAGFARFVMKRLVALALLTAALGACGGSDADVTTAAPVATTAEATTVAPTTGAETTSPTTAAPTAASEPSSSTTNSNLTEVRRQQQRPQQRCQIPNRPRLSSQVRWRERPWPIPRWSSRVRSSRGYRGCGRPRP
jgi:hypothetical protein